MTIAVAPGDRTSVLATLTAEIMEQKKSEARKLTPVAGERGSAVLPHDTGVFMSNEVLLGHAKALRSFAVDAIAIADGLDGLLNDTSKPDTESNTKETALVAKKAKEAEGDAKAKAARGEGESTFAADFAAKQAAAQLATFKLNEWVCPMHAKSATKTSAKTGRTYIGCPDCNLFKR